MSERRPLTARELLAADAFAATATLAEGELERLFWSYKGLAQELAQERSFFNATNEALAVAYERLETVQRALEQSNATLELRVAEGIARLREAERMAAYGQMVASVVHEIRQPLFAIKTVSFLLSQNGQEAEHLTILRKEARRLDALMEDLLDFAKPMPVMPQLTDVATLLHDAVEAFSAQAPASRLELKTRAAGAAPGRVDRMRVMQVLLNLLHNVHKHAAGATRVELEARHQPEGLVITVDNDGAPIARDVARRVFEPFFTTGKGTGLGLAIAERIVTAHGGNIAVAPLDAGTRFTLVFPP